MSCTQCRGSNEMTQLTRAPSSVQNFNAWIPFLSFLGMKRAVSTIQSHLTLYAFVTFPMQLTHQVFYPRLTPNRRRAPQLCTACSHWRPSTQFPFREATKHLALVPHLHQNRSINKLYLCIFIDSSKQDHLTTGYEEENWFLYKDWIECFCNYGVVYFWTVFFLCCNSVVCQFANLYML